MQLPYPLRINFLVFAATIGGYLFTSAAIIFLSAIVPMDKPDAIVASSLFSFAIYTAAVIWVFVVRDSKRAWLGMLIPTLLLGGAGLLISRMAS
ncbi:DUF3649 domain-containing protein [Methylophaga sulfidovorans]|uniref:DUF3649 domain-containing protein n=1 Tax=Methylophaga sulfidovorans TaxID=45496 RepID=A0A1I3XYP2_9GAMM|nr:DUF3649 domain-containing protein [Methylophaga sulfidovorans]SFK24106.1 Protein of unknown function [Methylophaga sulfidovorans]